MTPETPRAAAVSLSRSLGRETARHPGNFQATSETAGETSSLAARCRFGSWLGSDRRARTSPCAACSASLRADVLCQLAEGDGLDAGLLAGLDALDTVPADAEEAERDSPSSLRSSTQLKFRAKSLI